MNYSCESKLPSKIRWYLLGVLSAAVGTGILVPLAHISPLLLLLAIPLCAAEYLLMKKMPYCGRYYYKHGGVGSMVILSWLIDFIIARRFFLSVALLALAVLGYSLLSLGKEPPDPQEVKRRKQQEAEEERIRKITEENARHR